MDDVTVSVVIPTTTLSGRDVNGLSQDLQNQTVSVCEVVTINDVAPSGRARNEGARRVSGDVLVFLDDDVRLGHEAVLEQMIRVLNSDTQVGMVGASQLLPPNSSRFQRRAAHQLSRTTSPIVGVPTDSDMVTTACCAVRRNLFWELGGFNEHILRGVDPEFRYRVRKHGLRTVVAPRVWFYHPMPPTLVQLLRVFFRNGQLSAHTYRQAPWAALENPEGHTSRFVERRSTVFRAARHLWRLAAGICTVQWIGVAVRMAYAAGFFWPHSTHPRPGRKVQTS